MRHSAGSWYRPLPGAQVRKAEVSFGEETPGLGTKGPVGGAPLPPRLPPSCRMTV